MACGGRIYKGQDAYIEIDLADASGVTGIELYTGGDIMVEPECEICGDTLCISITKEQLEPISDGVIYYTVRFGDDFKTSNTSYYLKTPVGYTAASINEMIEVAYESGYTQGYEEGSASSTGGYESGYTDGYADGYSSGYTQGYNDAEQGPTGYTGEYFTIEALEDGVIEPFNGGVYYSINDGDWIRHNGEQIPVLSGDTVRFKGYEGNYGGFHNTTTLSFNVYGNVFSLLAGDYFKCVRPDETFDLGGYFAGCAGLVDASNLVLPSTVIESGCTRMFYGCTSLTGAPVLHATTMADSCYKEMFSGCTSLTTAPELPATTLADSCYVSMFQSCTSLTTAPALPATTLERSCYFYMFAGCTSLVNINPLPAQTVEEQSYANMFSGCTSLTTSPALLATTVKTSSCVSMFRNCTSLTTAPGLSATTVGDNSYTFMFAGCTNLTTVPLIEARTLTNGTCRYMFSGCTSLDYVKCLTTDLGTNGTQFWMSQVQNTAGTFVKNQSMESWSRNVNGIPSRWTVIDAQ